MHKYRGVEVYVCVCSRVWMSIGMYCNSSAVPLQLQKAISHSPARDRRQHPVARDSTLPSLSAMWDNVISWLEYSLHEMRFSYSLTRVIISWPIVSIWRPPRPPPPSFSCPACWFVVLSHSSFTFPLLLPSFLSIIPAAPVLQTLIFPVPLACPSYSL